MINIPYFKKVVKSNIGLWAIITLALCAFMGVMVLVFTPDTMGAMGGLFNPINSTLIGFMASSFYAMMAIIFPMIYSIIVGNNLVAKKVDDGSMASYLSTPVPRRKIIMSNALYLGLSMLIMWIVVTVFGIVLASIAQPDALDIEKFILLNSGAFLFQLAISGICFASSCIFNRSKNSLLLGAGLPLGFFVLSLLVKMADSLEFLKYITLTSLYDTGAILTGGTFIPQFIILGVIAVTLYVCGIIYFNKKNLPL